MAQTPDGIVGETMISPAQELDREAIAELYHRNHPSEPGRLGSETHITYQTFVARSDEEGQVVGMAEVIRLDSGVAPYGIIHQLEIASEYSGRERPDLRTSLTRACVEWLEQQGITLVYTRVVNKGSRIAVMLRYAGEEEGWVLDTAGPPPSTVRLPGQIFV